MSQPDQIFKEKLINYQRPAPAGAWSRVEASRAKKKSEAFFYRIAAAILLLASVTGIIWFSLKGTDRPEPLVSQREAVINNPEATLPTTKDTTTNTDKVEAEPVPDVITAPETVQEKVAIQTIEKPVINSLAENKSKEDHLTTQPDKQDVVETIDLVQEENLIAEAVVTENIPTASSQPEEDESSFKLVITADYVEQKYLNKNVVAEATEEEEKSSGLMKLLNKAYDLKSNKNPLGELRQKKNEILALNLQKDKKNNKN